MFERYTEEARRALFFARYEASQLGSVVMDTEHLLLGLTPTNSASVGHFNYGTRSNGLSAKAKPPKAPTA